MKVNSIPEIFMPLNEFVKKFLEFVINILRNDSNL